MENTIELEPLLDEKAAAKRLQQAATTLNKWRQRGRGPAFIRMGGKVRYRLSDLQQFVLANRVIPGERPSRRARRRAKARPSKRFTN